VLKYCVTTVGLPSLNMADQAKLLKRLGYDGVELRVRRVAENRREESPSCWGVHLNDITPDNFVVKAPEIQCILKEHGLSLAGIASNASCTDLEQVKLLLEGSIEAEAPFFRVGAAAGYDGSRPYRDVFGETVAGYAKCLECTQGSGVKILLEIHGGTIHPSASLAYRVVEQFDSADVGVIYDPQNMVKDGFETTRLAIDLLGPYLAHCHVGAHRPVQGEMDDKGTTHWQWEGCPMGEGLYFFPQMLQSLRELDYQGYVSVEDFRDLPPEEKYGEDLSYLKRIEPKV